MLGRNPAADSLLGDNTHMDTESAIRSIVVVLAPVAAGILALVASQLTRWAA